MRGERGCCGRRRLLWRRALAAAPLAASLPAAAAAHALVRVCCAAPQADGVTYERVQIERWLAANESSPVSGEQLPHKFLTPNLALKKLIAEATRR